MPVRSSLSALAACSLIVLVSACGNSGADALANKPLTKEPERTSAWTASYLHHDGAPHGKVMYDRFCVACHGAVPPPPPGAPPGGGGPMGPAIPPGTAELQVKYGGTPVAELEKRIDLTAEAIIYFVRHGVGVMPPLRKTELSDADLQSIADYLASAGTVGTQSKSE